MAWNLEYYKYVMISKKQENEKTQYTKFKDNKIRTANIIDAEGTFLKKFILHSYAKKYQRIAATNLCVVINCNLEKKKQNLFLFYVWSSTFLQIDTASVWKYRYVHRSSTDMFIDHLRIEANVLFKKSCPYAYTKILSSSWLMRKIKNIISKKRSHFE